MTDNMDSEVSSPDKIKDAAVDTSADNSTEHKQEESKTEESSPTKNGVDGAGDTKIIASPAESKVKDVEQDMDNTNEMKPKASLFESPVLVEGKRQRKKTARLSDAIQKEAVDQEKVKEDVIISGQKGKGTKLLEIPYTNHVITYKMKQDDMNLLHRLCFGIPGSRMVRRKNIKLFNGFNFEVGSSQYEKKLDYLTRIFNDDMKQYILFPLGLKKEKTKEETAKVVLDYCMCPKDLELKIPLPKKKAKTKSRKSKPKSKSQKSKTASEDKEGSDDNADSSDAVEISSDDDNADAESGDDDSQKSDKEEEKANQSKSTKKSSPKKKTKDKTEIKKKTPPKKANKSPKKKATSKKKPEELSSLSSDVESDVEPLVKKSKTSQPPSDEELKDVVKKILDNSDLEDLSIRKVFQQVTAMYPEFDLSERQKFIKNTVKDLIN